MWHSLHETLPIWLLSLFSMLNKRCVVAEACLTLWRFQEELQCRDEKRCSWSR